MRIEQHDAETRTLGHNNAEVVLRFCLPKLTAVVNSFLCGTFSLLLSDVACDHVLKVRIEQHDAETRTLGHNNAEVVLRFCLPKLTAVVNSSCVGPFLCFCRMLHVTMSWKCTFSSMMQKQGPSDTTMPKLYLDSAYQSWLLHAVPAHMMEDIHVTCPSIVVCACICLLLLLLILWWLLLLLLALVVVASA